MNKNRGFSLMELMIAVAIIGILAAIAYPSYTNSVIKGSRGAAKTVLMDAAQRQQQFLLDNRNYADTAAALGLNVSDDVSRFYTITITAVDADDDGPPTFVVKATPKAGTRQASDGWLQIDQTSAKTSEKPDKW